jgi:hypothetical protein
MAAEIKQEIALEIAHILFIDIVAYSKMASDEQIRTTLQYPGDLSYGLLKLHPYWDSLRGDPRFEKIVASLAPKDAASPAK